MKSFVKLSCLLLKMVICFFFQTINENLIYQLYFFFIFFKSSPFKLEKSLDVENRADGLSLTPSHIPPPPAALALPFLPPPSFALETQCSFCAAAATRNTTWESAHCVRKTSSPTHSQTTMKKKLDFNLFSPSLAITPFLVRSCFLVSCLCKGFFPSSL